MAFALLRPTKYPSGQQRLSGALRTGVAAKKELCVSADGIPDARAHRGATPHSTGTADDVFLGGIATQRNPKKSHRHEETHRSLYCRRRPCVAVCVLVNAVDLDHNNVGSNRDPGPHHDQYDDDQEQLRFRLRKDAGTPARGGWRRTCPSTA